MSTREQYEQDARKAFAMAREYGALAREIHKETGDAFHPSRIVAVDAQRRQIKRGRHAAKMAGLPLR